MAYRKAEKGYNDDLKQAHSVNQNYFWYLVRKARKKKGSNISPVLDDEGNLVSDADSIREAWRSYFDALAQPTNNACYDEKFRETVDVTMSRVDAGEIEWESTYMKVPFSRSEVVQAQKKLKWNKAPGCDGITTEHIRYGGDQVINLVTAVFNRIRTKRHFPADFRKGVRIPVYKGSGKKKEERTSYRGITLLSIFSKWLEHVLLKRAMDEGAFPVSRLQGAGQKGCSSMHTTFLLREAAHYHIEKGNDVQVMLLDTRRAFDTVWINGLFYRMYQAKVDFILWQILRSYYTDFICCVRIDCDFSDWFQVNQGVHQGGVLSMVLYQFFIDPLLQEITSTGLGCRIYGTDVSAPTQADDISLVTLFPKNSQTLLNIAYSHSVKWRYDFNVDKCCVILYSRGRNKQQSQLYLGGKQLMQVDSSKHMGVLLGKVSEVDIAKMVNKGKGCLAAVQSLGKSGHVMDVTISSKLYWCICIPSMLHGVEVMSLSDAQVGMLETGHRQMGKQIQGLPLSTPNPAVYPQIGWISMKAFIDKKLMMFLCKLMCNPLDNVYKEVMTDRILHLRYNSEVSSSPGAIMYQTCVQYGIAPMLLKGLDTGEMPSYNKLKKCISWAVMHSDSAMQSVQLQMYQCLYVYRNVIQETKLCIWWQLAEKYPKLRKCCRSAVLLLSWFDSRYSKVRCESCDSYEYCSLDHFICKCSASAIERLELIQEVNRVCPNGSHHVVDLQFLMSGGCDVTESGVIAQFLHSMVEKIGQLPGHMG